MSDNDLLSDKELESITGTRNARQQAKFLREQGLNPWTHPITGAVLLTWGVVKLNQLGSSAETRRDSGFNMDLDQIGA